MSDLDLTRADKAKEFQFIIETAYHLEAANGRFFSKLSHRDKDGDPNTIDKDDLKEALKLDDRKREFSRGFLSDTERKSVTYMLKHWDDEKFKVLKDDLVSSDSKGQEFRHQGFADISRQSVERAVSFYGQPIPRVDKETRPPGVQKREQQPQDAHRAPEQNRGQQLHVQQKSPDCPDHKPAKKELSEAEIIKNTQAYLSGKGEPKEKEEYKPFITQADAVKDEMRRRQIFSITPSYSTQESFHPEPAFVDPIPHPETIEPEYTFRDGVHDTLGIVGSLTDAATPFLMWDLAKDHARNQNNFYRRASHYDDYGHAPYRNFQDPYFRGHRNYGNYGNYGGYGNYGNFGRRFGGNFFPQDSDMEFSHAGPDGLTFSRSRQRVPHGGYNDYPRHGYNNYPRGGYNDYPRHGYDNYRGNGLHDTLDLLNGLSGAAMPWLQWDLAKQHARNQRDFYNRNRR